MLSRLRILRSPLQLSFQSFLKKDHVTSKTPSLLPNVINNQCSTFATRPAQETLPSTEDYVKITKDTISTVNQLIAKGEEGRLFAVVHLCGKQFKVTTEDIIIVEGYWPPKNGDELKLEKVLLVGGRDFTLLGRPILPQTLVTVKATVIEKDLSHTKTIFYKKRRKQYMRINFFRSQLTMLRINDILVSDTIDDRQHCTRQNERTQL